MQFIIVSLIEIFILSIYFKVLKNYIFIPLLIIFERPLVKDIILF
jgi:hypothetical protein